MRETGTVQQVAQLLDSYMMIMMMIYHTTSHLGGVMVSVLAIGLKIHGFKPSRGDGFLRAIKICSMPSIRGG
jgi:hypothetical protein